MISKLLVCGLLALTTLSNLNCKDGETSDTPPHDTVATPPPEPPPPPDIPTPSKHELLKKELEKVQFEIQVEDNTYRGYVGDATRATWLATDSTLSTEKQELYRERAEISYNAAKESEKKLNELNNKKDSIQTEINILNSQ